MLNFQHVTVLVCFLDSHIDPRNQVTKKTKIFLHRNIMRLQIWKNGKLQLKTRPFQIDIICYDLLFGESLSNLCGSKFIHNDRRVTWETMGWQCDYPIVLTVMAAATIYLVNLPQNVRRENNRKFRRNDPLTRHSGSPMMGTQESRREQERPGTVFPVKKNRLVKQGLINPKFPSYCNEEGGLTPNLV